MNPNPTNKNDKTNIGSDKIGTSSTTAGSLSAGTATARAKESDVNRSEYKSNTIADKVSNVASNISEKVNLDTIKEKGQDLYNYSREKGQSVLSYSRSNPGTVILGSIGVGFLVGYLFSPRRSRYQSYVNCIVRDSVNLIMDRYF